MRETAYFDRRVGDCGNGFDVDSIVQEWGPDRPQENDHMGVEVWRTLTEAQQQALIEKEVDANQIEKPVGYKVSFHYNSRVESHHFGHKHPMKPWRLTLTKQLVLSYGLHYAMDLFESRKATKDELAEFHTREYLDFLAESVQMSLHIYLQLIVSKALLLISPLRRLNARNFSAAQIPVQIVLSSTECGTTLRFTAVQLWMPHEI